MRPLLGALLFFTSSSFAQDSVKLSGNIVNRASDSLVVTYNDNRIAYYPNEFFARIDDKGNFSLAFPVPHGVYTQATIVNGSRRTELILHAGDSLTMTADARHFDSTIHFNGRGCEIQNFIVSHTMAMGRINTYATKVKTDINKEPADFLKAIANEKNVETDFLNKHKAGLPPSFISFWEQLFVYYNYFFIEQYPQTHAMVKVRRYTDTIPDANFSVVAQLPNAFNDSLLQVPSYLLYLTGVFEIKLKAAGYSYRTGDTAAYRRFQDSVVSLVYKLMPSKSAEFYLAQNLYGRARNQPLEKTENMYAAFKKRWPKSEYLLMLDKQVALAERLAPGQPAPDFDIITPDGKHTKLSELKGKVVYIDFWASWCKQCVGEIIKGAKMKELLRKKPLEFVYVSIDNDTTADNMLIEKYKMEGLFTHATGAWNAREVQLYGVTSLPAYFLIDEYGKFAMQNPPTFLQSTELILAIEKLFR